MTADRDARNAELRVCLGHRIRHARKLAGLTGAQLADRVGVSRSAVGQWEQGIAMPRANVQREIARALKVDWQELFAPSFRKKVRVDG